MINADLVKILRETPGLINRLQMSISARLILSSCDGVMTASIAAEILGMDIKAANRPIKELVDKGFLVRTGGDRKNGYIYGLV